MGSVKRNTETVNPVVFAFCDLILPVLSPLLRLTFHITGRDKHWLHATREKRAPVHVVVRPDRGEQFFLF